MFYFRWGVVINGAVKRSIEQTLQPKLKGNMSASIFYALKLNFSQYLLVAKMFKHFTDIYIYIYIY